MKNEIEKLIDKKWKLFPLHTIDGNGKCTCRRENCERPGKHPRTDNGFKDGCSDVETILQWFENGESNVGLVTGADSGIFVLDIDVKHGDGFESLKTLEQKYSKLPRTVSVNTGSGGKHLYFKLNGELIGCRTNVTPNIDVRGEGGYIITPPSRHESGNYYEWEQGYGVDEIEIAEAPQWLVDLIIEKPKREQPTSDSSLGNIKKGSRNDRLASIAGSLRHQGLNEEVIHEALQTINLEACEEPLSENEVELIAKSIGQYKTESKPTMKPIHISELAALPDVADNWLVEGYLPSVGIAGLIGKPKTFKSTFARQLSLAVAKGETFIGQRTTKGGVLYVCLEDHPKRFEQHLKELGMSGREDIYLMADIDHRNKKDRLFHIVSELKPRLVVVDTMQRFLQVADLSDYGQTTIAFDPYIKIARENNTLILFVHHAKKGQDESNDSILGSTAIFGSFDATLYLAKSEDQISLRTEQRYFANEPKVALALDSECRRLSIIGTVKDIENECLEDLIYEFLDSNGETPQSEILKAIPGKAERVLNALHRLGAKDGIHSEGKGVRGDPIRYRIGSNERRDKVRETRLDSRYNSSGQSPPEAKPFHNDHGDGNDRKDGGDL